ncbi:MAG TPA: GNAT family N-acetyltransferase [Acidimicrobiales bacterium]
MPHAVRHNPERSRYELVVDGQVVGVADYQRRDGAWVFPHTEIARERRGQGLGAELVRGALDDVRRAGGTVVPRCWYVADFIAAHPEYQDLLASRP